MALPQLNFPPYNFRFKKNEAQQPCIFDSIRKKWLVLTPEEWVRQNTIAFLTNEQGFPSTVFKIETGVVINNNQKRSDILVYKNQVPTLLVECKAPKININQSVLNQALAYNLKYNAGYVFLTNGLSHFLFKLANGTVEKLDEFLDYNDL